VGGKVIVSPPISMSRRMPRGIAAANLRRPCDMVMLTKTKLTTSPMVKDDLRIYLKYLSLFR
jgi:hypothetical protein